MAATCAGSLAVGVRAGRAGALEQAVTSTHRHKPNQPTRLQEAVIISITVLLITMPPPEGHGREEGLLKALLSRICRVAILYLWMHACSVEPSAYHPFSLHVVERTEASQSRCTASRWLQATCYGTMDVVFGRHPSERQRAICAIFQAPSSTDNVN